MPHKFSVFLLSLVGCLQCIVPAKADLAGFLAGDTIDRSIGMIDTAIDTYISRVDGLGDKYFQRIENLSAEVFGEANALERAIFRDARDLERVVFEDARELEAKAFKDAQALEDDIFKDISSTIWQTECAAVRLAEGTFKNAVTSTVTSVIKRSPGLKLEVFGKEIAKLVAEQNADVTPNLGPDRVYYSFKAASLSGLENYLELNQENADAYVIYATLLDISRLARQTSCHFLGRSTEKRFMKEHLLFSYYAEMWDTVVHVEFTE